MVEKATHQFVTNVGLITSDGPYGPNIMAAEWTHQIAYDPCLIAAIIHPSDATHTNIMKSKEFGVNLCAHDQNVFASISGKETGKEVDKIQVLQELGVEFYRAHKINVLMMKGAAMNAECKLFKIIELGDHTMFVGEALKISAIDKKPLSYHGRKYWTIGERIPKPPQNELDQISKIIEKYTK